MGTARQVDGRLEVRLIGALELSHGDRRLLMPASRKTRALFVYLLQTDRPVRRERLCELFFDVPDDPRAALRWSLSKIRTMLGPHADLLIADRERVQIRRDRIVTDVDRLRASLGEENCGDPEAALEEPLPGLDLAGLDDWNAWLGAERAEIDRLRSQFLTQAAENASLTPERRRLALREASALGFDRESAKAGQGESPAPVFQTVRYCLAPDGAAIAYACTGEGPPLVKAANWLNHLDLDWSGPVWGRLFRELSGRHSLVRYDERGNGLSGWDVDDLSLDAFVHDLETVVDTLGLERFPLLGISQGCAVSIEYAVRHPERVSRLILLGGYAVGWRHIADRQEAEQREAVITLVRTGWGQDNPAYRQIFSQTFMPSASHDELDWFNDFQRRTTSPENAVRFLEAFAEIDVRSRLSNVRAPTLVLHARSDQRVPLHHGIALASEIPDARLVVLETDSHIPLSREPATDRILEAIRGFLGED